MYVVYAWTFARTCVEACGGQKSTHDDISSIALHLVS